MLLSLLEEPIGERFSEHCVRAGQGPSEAKELDEDHRGLRRRNDRSENELKSLFATTHPRPRCFCILSDIEISWCLKEELVRLWGSADDHTGQGRKLRCSNPVVLTVKISNEHWGSSDALEGRAPRWGVRASRARDQHEDSKRSRGTLCTLEVTLEQGKERRCLWLSSGGRSRVRTWLNSKLFFLTSLTA